MDRYPLANSASPWLGWIAEPAIAHLLRPLLTTIGVQSAVLVHGIAFTIAFLLITAAHLVLGEQAPKIAAIRNPETAVLFSALPLRVFYYLSYPLLVVLSSSTTWLLRLAGIRGNTEHEIPHSEEEIRALIRQSHIHGNLSRSEHRLISAVFDFDELISRRIMVPRVDVVYVDINNSLKDILSEAKRSRHSRYPVCEDSMDKVVGVVHIKDLIGITIDSAFDIKSIIRAPQFIPETLPLRRLLRHFQTTHQHMAFLVDEYGTVTGILTLENVLEQIIGSVEDEFDNEIPVYVSEGPQQFVVSGIMPIELVNRQFGLSLETDEVDTISGLLMLITEKLLVPGDKVDLPGAVAEVLEVKGRRATKIRLKLTEIPPALSNP